MANRLEYIDLLKVFSILAIITIHAFMVWQSAEILNGVLIYSFCEVVRFGVPVFLMVSGALLLNREINIVDFFKKKVNRIVVPFVFYYILTAFVIVVLLNTSHNQVENIFAFRWYFWMILGVYLSLPVINKYVQNSSLNELRYFILLFVLAAIFYQITYYFKIEQYLYLTLFLSPLGYLILGYYLSKKTFNMSANKIVMLALVIFIVSTVIKVFGHQFNYMMITDDYVANTSPILSSWLDVSIFQIMQASSFFLMCKYIYETDAIPFKSIKKVLQTNVISKFVLSVSRSSYGMYLINLIPTFMFYYYIQPLDFTGTQVCLLIIALSLSTFFITWIIVVILGRIPFIKNLSGYY
ncbi:acyltransferase [Methanobrevibacter thaueri]|uniref:Acyltransferase family protein n=1 Tax=Methanobrevibacter thaueri TaxID=190975 RepID=A0A315XPI5_9EURY|nr:acyltransferase family protein [Methanobrevibacter thaueri]PWB88331.1 acyltransferase family protein [Methanobrevibacter thaueri]